MNINGFEMLLRFYRYKAKLTSTEASKKIGISLASYSSFENGRKVPKIENLKKISEALDIPYLEALEKWRVQKKKLKYESNK